jgi:dynactin complex subunit
VYIDGQWVASTGTGSISVFDSTNEQVMATIPEGTADDVKKAAAAGREGASQKELGALKDKYSKAHKNEGMAEASALEKFRQGAAEREKKHDAIEKDMKARHSRGEEDMKGSIDRLEKHINAKESVEEAAKKEDLELEQEFDMIESIIESIADQHSIDADLVWEDLSTLTDDELYVFAVTSEMVNEDWQKANKRDKTDGMSKKAVNAYRRENPGSKLKTAVTTKPSKLKAGSKAAKRRKSFCARMSGNKGPMKDEKGRPTPKAKALSRWNCE